MNLFDYMDNRMQPLAERMRPDSFDDFFGQGHIVGDGCILRRAVAADRLGSCIFYGPPGTGKTTLANIIANTVDAAFEKLNAVTSGVGDAKRIIEEARERQRMYGKRTYLLLDECHRWNKAQSDCVLAAIELGDITFIGSTTENPYISMTRAIISRCRIFEFKPLSKDDVIDGLKKAIASPKGLKNMNVYAHEDALNHIAWASAGDMRNALNALELAAMTTKPIDGKIVIDRTVAEQSIQKKSLSIDESMYYDMLSAFCKSLRGSDPDAALFWAQRIIKAGCDPLLIVRRLIVHSAEDVGMADPNAMLMAVQAMNAMEKIGMPEGMIPLTEAIIYVCEAPKSDSVINAMTASAEAAEQYADSPVPQYLRDKNYKGENKPIGYKYPHNYGGYVDQQYLPDELKDVEFYVPGNNGKEKGYIKRKKKLSD